MRILGVAFLISAILFQVDCYGQAQSTSTNNPLAEVTHKVAMLEQQKVAMNEQIQRLTQQMTDLSNQLGANRGGRSSFNTINDRLTDLERRLDRLERDMDRYNSRR
jgi:predicted  nucleic acid-binding Zn-ribbon protein